MAKKITFSNTHSTIEDIEAFYFHSEKSSSLHFIETNDFFIGYSKFELENELREYKNSFDRMCSLEVLAMLEARFKIDYLLRCQNKRKDILSKKFRLIHKEKENRASLTDDILLSWKIIYPQYKKELDKFQKALDYRNWLAHGRYWQPRHAPHISQYDYLSISLLGSEILKKMDLIEE